MSESKPLFPDLDMRPRHILATIAALTLAIVQSTVAAAEDPAKDEIAHLLKFVAASSCTFVRNGSEYPSDKARDHLASKYGAAGSRVSTADDFIKYLATRSSLTGEPYRVKCGGSEALSGVWLTDELNRYRKVSRAQATQ
jgi:hypothetical protein